MVSYKPLFRYCLEHDISKVECRRRCGISPNTWTKINRNEEVSMAILNKICAGLGISYTRSSNRRSSPRLLPVRTRLLLQP